MVQQLIKIYRTLKELLFAQVGSPARLKEANIESRISIQFVF